MSERMVGSVINLLPNKGFGFIRGAEDRLSRFMHAKCVEPLQDFERLIVGTAVEFESAEGGPGGNGLRALHVKIIKGIDGDTGQPFK